MKRFALVSILMFLYTAAWALPPSASIEYQPMTSEGLAAGKPFEAWIVFDMSANPVVPGLALPAGSTFRFKFPQAFEPQSQMKPAVVLLYGWPQKGAPVPFTVGLDPKDPRTIVLRLTQAFPVGPPESPGLKAIHLRWGPINPKKMGDYPIAVELADAGEFSGRINTTARITTKPVPNVAGYNQLHDGRNENWQHVRLGQEAALPIDFLVTLPDKNRSFIALRSAADGNMEIISDGAPIGKISQRGVPLILKPVAFGPGYARLGIIRVNVTAGSVPGTAEIEAHLNGGTAYKIQVIVEP